MGKEKIVGIGSTVLVLDLDDNAELEYHIVANNDQCRSGVLSPISPIGQALIGHKAGDELEFELTREDTGKPVRTRHWEVLEVR